MSDAIELAAPEQVSPEQVVEDQAVPLQVSSEEVAPEEVAAQDQAAPVQPPKYEKHKLYDLDITVLSPDPNQPRKTIDPSELTDLANSIKVHGVLQPILFRQGKDGELIIVSGERRFKASISAKKEKIPAIYIDGKHAEIAIIENLLRVDLAPLEEAEGLKKLQEEAGYKNKQLAAVIGKAESSMCEILSLNKLPEKIKEKIKANPTFSRRQLIEIAKIKDEKEQLKRFNAVKKMNESDATPKEKKKDDKRSQESTTVKRMIEGLKSKLEPFDLKGLEEPELAKIKAGLQEVSALILKKLSEIESVG